jgi:hypothetical protein
MESIQEIPDAIEILTKKTASVLDRRQALIWLDNSVFTKVSDVI